MQRSKTFLFCLLLVTTITSRYYGQFLLRPQNGRTLYSTNIAKFYFLSTKYIKPTVLQTVPKKMNVNIKPFIHIASNSNQCPILTMNNPFVLKRFGTTKHHSRWRKEYGRLFTKITKTLFILPTSHFSLHNLDYFYTISIMKDPTLA